MEWIAAAVMVLILLYAVFVFNRLVRQRNSVREGWSGIDVQLRRRTDLIPNLVETVKAYAAHERGVFEEVTQKRASSIAASSVDGQATAERALSGSLGRLMAVAEAYPELKADANFRDLQDKLSGIEDEIQLSRRYYNGAVRNLNTMIQSFPSNFVANFFKFTLAEFFEIGDAAAREVPKVDFKK